MGKKEATRRQIVTRETWSLGYWPWQKLGIWFITPRELRDATRGPITEFLVPFWVMCLFSFRDLRFSREKQTTEAVLDSQGKCVLGQEGCSPSDSCLPSSGAKSHQGAPGFPGLGPLLWDMNWHSIPCACHPSTQEGRLAWAVWQDPDWESAVLRAGALLCS